MKKMLQKRIKLVLTIVFLVCLVPLLATADEQGYAALTNIEKQLGVNLSNDIDLSQTLSAIFKWAIGIAGVLAVVMITWGGIEYMTTEAIGSKGEAKKRIWSAIWGLILALSSYLILSTINPDLLEIEFLETLIDSINYYV